MNGKMGRKVKRERDFNRDKSTNSSSRDNNSLAEIVLV
jgi:hypothetical protein